LVPQGDARIGVVPGENESGSSMLIRGEMMKRQASVPVPIDVAGVPVVPFESYDQALGCIERAVESGRKAFWVAINARKCYDAWHSPELMDVLRQATVGICDGIGVVVASKILHGRWIDRITGCDLFFKTVSLASQKNWGVFLLGASPESNSGAYEKLREMYPNLRIVGRQDGYFKDSSAVIEQINASKADLLFVAMGSPKQEYWIGRHRQDIDAAFCMGVGGSFDVAAGNLVRAPKIFQRMGLEFLYQLVTEPGKRWRRQITYFPFMLRIVAERIFGEAMVTGGHRELGEGVGVSKPFQAKDLQGIVKG
jgi:N-acetylglucosaminyldiphosphoundecaprenol N-acetyl-beta-D-mannosaminyltransferase